MKNFKRCIPLLLCMVLLSCSEINFDMPVGPKGDSAYNIWKAQVEAGTVDWPTEKTDVADFLVFIKGAKGDKGEDGKSAYEIWKDMIAGGDTPDPHDASKKWDPSNNSEPDFWNFITGRDGQTPYIGTNGNWFISGNETGFPSAGKDGTNGATPQIGTNGNWFIDGVDTGYPARGANGADGPTPVVGANGNWIINGVDTGYRAIGQDGSDGTNGVDGMSAYNLWKEDLANRNGTSDPMKDHKTGQNWNPTQNSLNDFWEYLRGKDGKDHSDGTDGQPGTLGQPGAVVVVVAGVPNVIAVYSQSEYGEYVRTTDGGVEYKVYDVDGSAAPGAVVTGMPGIDPAKSYTANSEGTIFIPKEDLPEIQNLTSRFGRVSQVNYNGVTQESASNTYVPNRIHTRLVLDNSYKYLDNVYNLIFQVERKVNPNDEWEILPNYLPEVSTMYFTGILLEKN